MPCASRRALRVGAAVGIAIGIVVIGVAVVSPRPTRLGILATRALVITAAHMPPAFSTILTRVLGLGREGTGRAAPDDGPGGPILVIVTERNPFTRYLAEILRAEGLNLFAVKDVAAVDAATLAAHDVVLLGEMPLAPAQTALLDAWTNAGGTLVAMRPDRALAQLLGLVPAEGTLADRYLRVDTSAGPGAGIVDATMQFHGTADLWRVADATPLATLHDDAVTRARHPAVTMRKVGVHGGTAVAFTYDLARSVVYTRQGNPASAGRDRDGAPPRRVVDLFTPDWLDVEKVAIPQADEQQRLLANVILAGALHRTPLPRFWYLPKDLNAAVVMTGDGHDDRGLVRRFETYRAASPVGCSVDDWECVRATGYVYLGTTLTAAEVERWDALGFEVGVHVNTDCVDWSPASLTFLLGLQLRQLRTAFPGVPPQVSSRTHCVAWSDWSSQAEIEAAHGIRFDANYYLHPASWTRGRAGFFTGSGFPMRFATRDGALIDAYQAATQLTDEAGLAYPQAADELLARANGPEGYYGVFTANMHLERPHDAGSDQVIASARAHGVPVVSARQMLRWLDGRNASSFGDVRWSADTLRFTITVGTGARHLSAMLPVRAATGRLRALTRDGAPVAYAARTVKGIDSAFFSARPGAYAARYEP